MLLRQIFDAQLSQYAYLIGCQRTGEALLIDPERDIDRYRELAAANGLRITAVAETHIHADFVSGAQEFAGDPGVHLFLSAEGGVDWSYRWPGDRANTHWLRDNETFSVGRIDIRALHTPGHTPEHMSYLVTDRGGGASDPMVLVTGDFVFVGDVGRPDLLESAAGLRGVMEPSARDLAKSLVDRLAPLEDFLQILPGHGAGSACGKALGAVPMTTLGYERRFNQALRLALRDGGAFVQAILDGQPEPPPYFATMKRVNRDGIRVTGEVPVPPCLSIAQFRDLVAADATHVIDCRDDRRAFAAGHFAGSIHAPLHSPFFSTACGSYLDDSQMLVLLAGSDADAQLAARYLYRIGLDGVVGWLPLGDAFDNRLMESVLPRVEFVDFDPKEARERGVIVDVRTQAEFAKGHLDGAQSFPYTRLRERFDALPTEARLYIHCGSGKRASLASSYLKMRGKEVVYVDGICTDCERIAEAEGVPH